MKAKEKQWGRCKRGVSLTIGAAKGPAIKIIKTKTE